MRWLGFFFLVIIHGALLIKVRILVGPDCGLCLLLGLSWIHDPHPHLFSRLFLSNSMTSSHHQSERYLAAATIVRVLGGGGHQAYFAGGCVRDLLLGRVAMDFDVATSATPDVVMGLLEKTFLVGAHFGVVLVCVEVEGVEIATEVATFRHDGAYSDGRRPDAVQFSTDVREDVLRRGLQ